MPVVTNREEKLANCRGLRQCPCGPPKKELYTPRYRWDYPEPGLSLNTSFAQIVVVKAEMKSIKSSQSVCVAQMY